MIVDDVGRAVRLARQAEQITAGIPGRVRPRPQRHLNQRADRGADLAAAESICAAGLVRCRAAHNRQHLAQLLIRMVHLDLEAGRIKDAAAHLREALQILVRAGGLV